MNLTEPIRLYRRYRQFYEELINSDTVYESYTERRIKNLISSTRNTAAQYDAIGKYKETLPFKKQILRLS